MERYTAEHINRLGLPFIDHVEDRGEVRIVRLKGAIDKRTLPAVLAFRERVVREAGRQDRHLLLDMQRVTHVDGTAVAVLMVNLAELKRAERRLALIHVTDEMLSILSVFEYTSLFEIYETEPQALASLGG